MTPLPLERGKTYHIFNRGNNRENLFREKENYDYFLRLYLKHIHPIADTYAYALLKNHFHFLVRLKTVDEIVADLDRSGFKNQTGLLTRTPSRAFGNFFVAYTKAFNKRYNRTGALFESPFERIPVEDDRYFDRLVIYIHQNPQKHRFVDDFRDWPYSSYGGIVSDQPSRLAREAILNKFDGIDRFIAQHKALIDLDVAYD